MRRIRGWMAWISLAVCAGCAPFTQAQMDLVEQAQRGVAQMAAADAAREGASATLAKLRRERLDEAFDQDVRERALRNEPIDAEWVIEARRAYAVALEIYAKAHAASEQSAMERRRTLAAIDAALERVRWLQSIQLRLDFTSELREERP